MCVWGGDDDSARLFCKLLSVHNAHFPPAHLSQVCVLKPIRPPVKVGWSLTQSQTCQLTGMHFRLKTAATTIVWVYWTYAPFAFPSWVSPATCLFQKLCLRSLYEFVSLPLSPAPALHIVAWLVCVSLSKYSGCLENTIVALKKMTLIVFFFCPHHNNTLQVIIKLEIFFVFLTQKNPFYVSANYEW